jgi:uncharacterized cupredoxin-like copper-binding protein
MRKRSVVLIGAAASAVLLSLAACSHKAAVTPTPEVHVKLTEYKVELDKTTIPAGPVKFVIENAGQDTHELVLEPAGVDDKPLEANGKESEAEDIKAGTSTSFEWTIDKPGEYQLACHIKEDDTDHYGSGMVAKFTVTR